jgi:hypothetical protein
MRMRMSNIHVYIVKLEEDELTHLHVFASLSKARRFAIYKLEKGSFLSFFKLTAQEVYERYYANDTILPNHTMLYQA